jgi:hypothetical protein
VVEEDDEIGRRTRVVEEDDEIGRGHNLLEYPPDIQSASAGISIS